MGEMLKKLTALTLVASTSAYAGYASMGTYEAATDSNGGGTVTFGTIVAVVLFFGGIFWFMTRFKSDQDGFFWLMGAVLALVVIGGVANCSG
jgi:hypothetical protein